MTCVYNFIGILLFALICIGLLAMIIWAIREFLGKNPTWFN